MFVNSCVEKKVTVKSAMSFLEALAGEYDSKACSDLHRNGTRAALVGAYTKRRDNAPGRCKGRYC